MSIEFSILSVLLFIILCVLFFSYRRQLMLKEALAKLEFYFQHVGEEIKQSAKATEATSRQSYDFINQQHQLIAQQFSQLREQLNNQQYQHHQQLAASLNDNTLKQEKSFAALREYLQTEQSKFREHFDQYQLTSLKGLQESLQTSSTHIRQLIADTFNNNAKVLDTRLEKLTQETNNRLREISGQVEKRLAEGFEKTTATFTDVVKRLALIDAAQQKITELSSNVVSLQEILVDKRSRGAFGEVQLNALIRNVLPESSFAFQATLSNGKRADCILYLPEPTGNVVIDAKFPLENFRLMTNLTLTEEKRKASEQQFRIDIKKHIQDIAEKYIISNETADGAVMFIPAEAVFGEIHGHFPDLIDFAHRHRVWLVSPTTMMAILTTARAVLKDAATRQQVHIIQEHLQHLSKDFDRFQKRMDNLAKHIEQANSDIKDVHMSARKITSRFEKIEKVELEEEKKTLCPAD